MEEQEQIIYGLYLHVWIDIISIFFLKHSVQDFFQFLFSISPGLD